MKSITELVDIPEEEYSLYLQEYKDNGVAYGSDSSRDANFRYETESRQEPKQHFFGKVKNPFPKKGFLDYAGEFSNYLEKPIKKYIDMQSTAYRATGRTLVSVVPNVVRGLTRAWQEGVTERFAKYSSQFDIAKIDSEMRELEKRSGFDNMTVEQKRDFYKNNPEYNKLASQLDSAYDKIINLESPEYKKQVDEVYGNLKKTQQQFIEKIGLGEKPEDSKIINTFFEGVGSLVEALAITFVTKNPTAAGVVFGAQQGAGLYEELREKGVDVDKSLAIAGAGGVAEGVLEYKGLDKLIENMAAKTLGKSVAKNFAVEATQEASQQTAEEALMLKYRNDESYKEKVMRIGESALVGGVLGSAATIVSRPFLMRYANDVKETLVQNGVDEQRADELTSDAVYGTLEERDKASHDIQVAIGSSQFAQMGFSPEESEQLAETFALTGEEIRQEILDSANAEIDPETYEGGTVADGAKFFDENLKKDYIAEDFDIQEAVQEEAEKNHLPKEEAELAGKLVESFARVMYNKTGQTPKEFWESGGKLMIRDQRVSEMEDVDESELTPEEMDVVEGKNVLFQGSYDVIKRMNEIDKEEEEKGVPEYTVPTININGVERQTTNSRGDPIAKSERSLRYFYDWFKDSKVVDKQGRPLVVYHGTRSDDFSVFDRKYAERGFFFATEQRKKSLAGWYARDGGKIMPVYLSLQNPFIGTPTEYAKAEDSGELYKYDGVISLAEDTMTSRYYDEESGEIKTETIHKGDIVEIVAFEPNQIKSIDNRGTFSEHPDIYYQSKKEEKDLYATHNMSLAGVRDAIKLGGLAMPSMALRKISQGNINQFGDIVFVGNEHLAKPSRSTEVYDRDAWTPNLGGIVRYDLGAETNKLIKDVLNKVGQSIRASTFRYNIEAEITRPQDNTMAMELYALDKGLSEEESSTSVLYNNKDYLDWYEENIFSKAEPYLWTENDANTDMIRRKFTLQNMIKVLKKQERSGGGFIGDYIFDVYKLLNFYSQKFSNLKEIKKNKGKLVSREEQFEAQKKLNDEFVALSEELKKEGQKYDFGDATYGVGLALLQKTDKEMKYWLDYKNLKSDEDALNKVKDFVEKMKNIPTDYFEVKPRRAVQFNEFSGVIIPQGKQYDDVANILEKQYYMNVERVEKGNEAQYEQALQNIQKKSPTTFFQGDNEQQRASYTQGAYEKIINIFKNGDKSSIVHELGHYFTMNYIDVLTKYNQLDEVTDVLNWLGVNSVDELQEEHWEKFARGFETYVMEGVSPNQKVASLFERFKQWLIQVYKDFVPEEINDDVRAFFDKMLASEEDFNYEEIMRLGNDMQSLREVMKNALAGKEVQTGGMNIADVKKLMNVLSTRIPRKPKTLVELFKDVGINEAFAKKFDLDALLGVKDLIQDEETLKQLKKRGLITQKQINQARKLITKEGGISSEDEMIDFLSGLGLLTNVSDTYEGTSATWDEALNLIENAENIFRPQDIEQAEKREQILDAIYVAEKSLQGIGKYEDVMKAVKALAKENIVSVQKETLKYIKNKQKELQKDYNALLRKMLKAQKKDLQSVRDAVVDYIKGQPISGDDKVKLMGFIKKANSLNSLHKVSESIKNKAIEYYDNEQRKMLNKEIQRELKKTRPTSMTEQRYDYENNKLFIDLRNYNKLTKEKASEELAKLPMDEESISNLSEIDLIKRRFLSYKAGGADASTELLEQVLTDIVDAKEKGKLAKNEQEHEKMLKQEEDRQELLTILDEKKADPKSLSSKLQSIYRRGFTSLYSLLDSIFGKNVADKYQMEVKQTDVNSKIYFKSSEVINNSARIFGVKGRNGLLNLFADMASKKYTITNSEGVNKEIDAFAIIDIYNAIKNEKTKNDYYEAFGEEQVNGLVNTLTVQQRAFGDYLMQEVNNYYDKLNKVYVKLYGIDLPRVDNYWMATSEHRDAIDIQGDYFQQTTIPSALKERSRGRVVPIPKNAWEKFNKHIAEAEYISGLGLDYMNVKKIFKSNRIKGKIIEKYGEGIYKDIMNDIESLSMASKIQEIDAVTGLFQKILNNFVTAKIAIGIPVFVKQLTSCTNYAVDMPIAKWVSGFAEGLLHPRKTAKYMMDNAQFLKARFGQGYNEAVERVIREAQKHSGKKVRWIEAMSSFTRFGDIGAIIYGGYPYLKYLQESGDKDAIQKFEFATLRSQQAGTPVSLSPFQRQRGMMRVFQAFNNTPTQYMRMLADAVYQYTNGDITGTKFAKQMFNFGLIQPILYVLAGTMAASMLGAGDDDDDIIMDIVRQILLNPIDAIPVFSDLAGALFDKMSGQKNYGLRPVLVQDIDKLMRKLNKDDYDAWDVADIITPIIEGMSGAPAGRAVRILKTNFKD